MDNTQIHFSISKSTLILVSIIIAVLLIIIFCLAARGGRHDYMMMRQGQNGRAFMRQDKDDGRFRSGPNGQGQRDILMQRDVNQPTSGAVEIGASTSVSE